MRKVANVGSDEDDLRQTAVVALDLCHNIL